MSEQQLKALKKQSAPPKQDKAAAKRKRTAKPQRIAGPVQSPNLQVLAREVQQTALGWDPRVTHYVDNLDDLKEIKADKLFSRQVSGVYDIGGAKINEEGAFRTDAGVRRIVKVVWQETVE